jgi:diguanylate cyclase (GGDEF)-like protein
MPNVAELTQKSLGLVREVLFEMESEDLITTFEKNKFWKEVLFDAGFPPKFIAAAKSYDFRWTDIIPDLFTAKFRERHLAKNIPPALCEQFLGKLVRFAYSAESSLGEALQESLINDGFYSPSVQTQTPAALAKLPTKDSLLKDLVAQITNGKLVSLVFIDLDNFKQVNDQHGHPEGDKCLVEVVDQVSAAILGKGKLYRVGGDEFCVLLPNFYRFEAAATAERIRQAVNVLTPFGGTTKVTTSIGVADSSTEGLATPESLVKAADDAMYISKWTTKNRVTIWPPSEPDRQLANDHRERVKSGQGLGVAVQRVQNLQEQPEQSPTEEGEKKQQQEQRRRIRTELAKLFAQGEKIRDGIEYSNPSSVIEKADWKIKTQRYLTENLDESYTVRFRSPIQPVTAYPQNMHAAMRVHWADVTASMATLRDFMADLRDS